jgi:aspartate aminotransferase
MKLSERTRVVKPSPTMAIVSEAAALRAKGVDVISCGVGEPDFDTPRHIRTAAAEAMERGETRYTPVGGTAELRAAIADKLARENGLSGYSPDTEICVSCGGKHALFNAFLALVDPGDEVLVVHPYWVSYPDIVAIAGGRPVIVPTRAEDGFKVRPEDLLRRINPRTRAVILNSPSNPAGVVYNTEEIRALAEALLSTNVVVVTDDIYERILYVPPSTHIGVLAPALRDRLLVVNSLSKTYAMTGWRIGYTAGPAPLIKAMVTLQGQSTSNPTSIAQAAGVAALAGPQDAVREMVQEFRRRRSVVLDRFSRMAGFECVPPDGAFYAFVDVSALLGRRWEGGVIKDSDDVAGFLLASAHVAVVGGSGFGSSQHIRYSFALDPGRLNESLDRMEAAIARLE